MDTLPISEPLERLNTWLSNSNNRLPRIPRRCLENFVLSCENPDQADIDNFISTDIIDFSIPIQEKMVTGFFYAYTGLGYITYHYDNAGFIPINNN